MNGKARARCTLLAAGAAVLCLLAAAAAPAAGPSFGGWSAPVSVGPAVNTASGETNPALSPDGLSLYFDSNRAGGSGARDLWVSKRATPTSPWGAPVNLGVVINTSVNDANPGLSADGHWLFFVSPRAGGFGDSDLYQSYRADVHDDLGWQAPTNLGAGVNTSANESGTGGYFENGGHPQLYFGSNRAGGPGGGSDIYMASLGANGVWGSTVLVPELSSASIDNRPNLRPDGLEIFIYSTRPGGLGGQDLWASTRATTDAAWSAPVNLGATVNTASTDSHPYVSADGRELVLDSDRPGGAGDADLYVITRPARLTVTADDETRLFGHINPPLTYEVTGFVGGDTAAVVSGTASCSTTATPASPAGAYPITCTVGSLSAAGYVFDTFLAGALRVSYSRPCLTEPSVGPLHVAAGQAVCIGAGGNQTGPITIAPGGSLDVEGGRITGPVVANGAAVVRVCSATITGPLTISGSTGPVLVAGAGCQPNTIIGPVRVTDNTDGVEVVGNTVVGPLRVTGNAPPVHATGNTVTGPVTIQP